MDEEEVEGSMNEKKGKEKVKEKAMLLTTKKIKGMMLSINPNRMTMKAGKRKMMKKSMKMR